MDRRAVLGRSKAELTMARVGHVVALLCAFVLLPLLPFLALYLAGAKVVGSVTGSADDRSHEPEYAPGA
ncbi:MAG: hypothetical protein ABEJ74_06865 [Haloferacaceae archaeon]